MVVTPMVVMVVLSCGLVQLVMYMIVPLPVMKLNIMKTSLQVVVVVQYTCKVVMKVTVLIPHLINVHL